jgi:hypothetical protein
VTDLEWYRYGQRSDEFDRETLERFQDKLGIRFPDPFVDFVARHTGMVPEDAVVAVGTKSKADPGVVLSYEPGCVDAPSDFPYSAAFRHQQLVNQFFSEKLVPFMEGGGGDLALDFRATDSEPQVVFIDGESEGDEALHPIADDFQTFLAEGMVVERR